MKKIFILFVMVLLASLTFAETNYRNASGGFGGSLGYNLYSPSDHIKSAYSTLQISTYTAIDIEDGGTYGGLCFNLWGLFKIGNSPLKMGFALGGTQFRHESFDSGYLVWSDTGESVGSTINLVGFQDGTDNKHGGKSG